MSLSGFLFTKKNKYIKSSDHIALKSLVAILLCFNLLTGCSTVRQIPPNTAARRIFILQYGKHPVIDLVVSGFRERVNSTLRGSVTTKVFSANFDGKTSSSLAKQLVASDADLLVGVTTPASANLIGASRGIKPIIFSFVTDLKVLGYNGTNTLSNTTGLSDQIKYDQTLLMIKEFMPNAKNIGYLVTRSESNALLVHEGFKKAAPSEGMEIRTAMIGSTADIRKAAELLSSQVDLFLVGGDNTLMSGLVALLDVANARGKPVFANDELSVEKGALAAFSVDYKKMGEKAADMASVILAGANPENIPVELYYAENLVINRNAAIKSNIRIPKYLERTAKRIID